MNMMLECLNKKNIDVSMNKFSFYLQSTFLFVGETRDVIFKMKSRWHEGFEERKKCICCMVRNAIVFSFFYFWCRPYERRGPPSDTPL